MDRPNKRYVVRLDAEERELLRRLVSVGKAAARKLTRARILLQADQSDAGSGWTDERIAEGLGATVRTIEHVRRQLVEEGLEAALERRRPYNPKRPVVCMDETSKQLVKEARVPQPAAAGQVARFDYEYERNGTANVYLLCEPLAGRRQVSITDRRTRQDWAGQIRELLDVHYPRAERVTLVMDNLNTHSLASLYEAFEPQEARRLIDRLEVVHTPKHGSWLNMAEIELGILSRQCMGGRIPGKQMLVDQVKAWQTDRNRSRAVIDWQFTTADARIRLRRLYPKIQE